MHRNTKKARNKLRFPQTTRRTDIQRIRHEKPKMARRRRSTIPQHVAIPVHRFLTVKLPSIPYFDLQPDEGNLIENLKNVVGPLFGRILQIDDQPETLYLAEFAEKMDVLCKEFSLEWCVAEVNECEPVIVPLYNHGGLGGWLAPRLSFLPMLKRRSERLHDVVLNSFRHMTQQFSMGDISEICFLEDWADERLCNDEFDTAAEKREFEKCIQQYNHGMPAQYFSSVRSSPKMTIAECIKGLTTWIPKDLVPLMNAVRDVLHLVAEGDEPINYDVAYGGGFSDGFEGMCDNGELSLDYQFCWRWDDDPYGGMAEEYMEDLGNNCGVCPMISWRIFGKGFTAPESVEDLRNILGTLKQGFPERFNNVLDHLCFEIENIFPSKFNRR